MGTIDKIIFDAFGDFPPQLVRSMVGTEKVEDMLKVLMDIEWIESVDIHIYSDGETSVSLWPDLAYGVDCKTASHEYLKPALISATIAMINHLRMEGD